MVFANLSKLMKFVDIISKTPKEVSKRKTRLIKAYGKLEADTTDIVSIKIKDLERFTEMHLDDEEDGRKQKILELLIDDYTDSKKSLPQVNDLKTYLFPSITNCLNSCCCQKSLIICRPSRTDNSVSVFTLNGVLEGEIYRKVCQNCQTLYYYNYFDKTDMDGQLVRTYYDDSNSKESSFFSTTNETFFAKDLLDSLNEEIVTSYVQFVNWSTCYNRLKAGGRSLMSCKLAIPAWLIYQIWRRISVSFPVVRDKARNLDIEQICAYLYPQIREHVDKGLVFKKGNLHTSPQIRFLAIS